MGTQQKVPNPEADKALADWEIRWKRDREHSISEKKVLLSMVMTGTDYLRLLQQKLVQELEDLGNAKPPSFVIPEHLRPSLGTPGQPGGAPLKTEKG